MSNSDRAFRLLLIGAGASGIVLALPLALTIFPGAIQGTLHGYDGLVRACTAAVYHLGERLPPLGIFIIGLATFGAARALQSSTRTWIRMRALAARRRSVVVPASVRRLAGGLGIESAVRCFASPLPLAYTAGARRPLIWLSVGLVELLSDAELEAVLLHEGAHVRRRDPLRLMVARATASLLGLVPWVDALTQRFEVAKELDADREALLRQGSPTALASAMLAIGEHPFGDRLFVSAWSLSSARIDQLYGKPAEGLLPRPRRGAGAFSGLALSAALLLSVGQSARANVLPAGWIEAAGILTDDPGAVHFCPVPATGVLF